MVRDLVCPMSAPELQIKNHLFLATLERSDLVPPSYKQMYKWLSI